MTELPIPTPDKLMWPTLKAIRELGGSARNAEIEAKVIEIEKYSDAVIAVMHTDRQTKIQYRLAWARTQLKTIGALESRETTVWVLTDVGQNISESKMMEVLKVQRSRDAMLKSQAKKALNAGDNDDGVGGDDVVVIGEPWIDEMLDLMNNLSPAGFESLCQRILREHGFVNVVRTGGSNDKGIDGRGTLKTGLLSWDVIFQCKRYKESVGSQQMREFKGTMTARSEKGLFMTTGTFTKDAVIESKRDGARPIELFDGEALCRLMREKNLGLKVVMEENVTVQKDFFDQFR